MKILIIKTSSLGDIVHAFPVVEYLHTRYPNVTIDWVVEAPFSDLISAHPKISRVIEIDTKSWKKNGLKSWKSIKASLTKIRETSYNLVIDLQGNTKSGIITFFSKSHNKVGFSYKSLAEWPNLLFTDYRFDTSKEINIRDLYLSLVRQFFRDDQAYQLPPTTTLLTIDIEDQKKLEHILSNEKLNRDNLIMICPGAQWKNKQLSVEQLQLFIKKVYIAEKGCSFIFIWGNEIEKMLCNTLIQPFEGSSIVLDRIPLPLLQNLMTKMKKVIAMDSLPLHLAGTTAVETFGIFGPSSAEKYAPKGSLHTYFQGSCPYQVKFDKRCHLLRKCKTGACIKAAKSDDLMDAYSIKRPRG